MRKAPSSLQDLRRQIYREAKSDKAHRFWGLFVHLAKAEPLAEAYPQAKRNGGAPGPDGQTFAAIEAAGCESFREALGDELRAGTYQPQRNRAVEVPKGEGKVRKLQIPWVRDRGVQGALKLILEAIFEADCCPNSYGYRPQRSPQQALAEVRRSLLRRRRTGLEVDVARYFDTIRHSLLLEPIARRVQDPAVFPLVKQSLKAGGKLGGPHGGPFSPLAANLYLNEVDWAFDAIRRRTAQGPYEAVNYQRFADDIAIAVSGHHTKRGWAARAVQRLQEHLARLGVGVNLEKTAVADPVRGETLGFWGVESRRVRRRTGDGHFLLVTPRKEARLASQRRLREVLRHGGATPRKELIAQLNMRLAGWVQYYRGGNASRAFSEMRDYVEMKVRTLLTRRKRRRKRSVGWRRWSKEYLYGVLGLYWDWELRPLPGAEAYQGKAPPGPHRPITLLGKFPGRAA
jgi:RNA-directed DNA polymerase